MILGIRVPLGALAYAVGEPEAEAMPLLVKKPISVLDKKVTIAWRDAFRTLGKSIIHLASGKVDDLGTDLIELADTVGLVHAQGDVAWLLIRRALMRALSELLRDHRDLFRVDLPDDQDVVAAEAGLDIDDQVLELDERFFRDPVSLDILETLRPPLAVWLETYGLQPTAARVIAERLRPYFVLALHDEWGRAPADYAKLRDALDTPFTRAQDLERAWLRYEAHLWRVVNEPMFAEPFGLKTVYVPLRGFWERPADKTRAGRECDDTPGARGDGKGVDRIVVDLKTTLDLWLLTNKKDDALRVLSGGPGSGKSSFTRMYAAEAMTSGRVRVLYVPLHLFDPKGDLISAVGDYVRTTRTLPSNPLDVASGDEPRRLLLIFDGLDELAITPFKVSPCPRCGWDRLAKQSRMAPKRTLSCHA